MSIVFINRKTFRDKVMGCWLGKNAGGTLGEPLEGKFGNRKMTNISWYTSLSEGGIPNDDLELQLIWLQLILQKGPAISSEDFVEAWQDCIAYNFDEYGLSKENMQKGLLPPVCGWNNNCFKDCMGSPIRSEIWACLSPGNPKIADHYAFLDAIVDHGGGESVYGECFNAIIQANAFINSDKFSLLETALASIPKNCLTYKCVRKSIDNFNSGMGYEDNRNNLLNHFFNPVSQFSPLNLGFQTIGWLYGSDFGDALCKAVNCGWDTDCTAATLGAILGIIGGASSLPEKWIAPLGYEIATNMGTGGIRNLTAPTDIRKLTETVCSFAEKVASFWSSDLVFSDNEPMTHDCVLTSLSPDRFAFYKPNELNYHLGSLDECISYEKDAFILGDRVSKMTVRLTNNHKVEKIVKTNLSLASGFVCPNTEFIKTIMSGETVEYCFEISASDKYIQETNTCYLMISSEHEPAIPAIPLVFLGGSKWLVSQLIEDADITSETSVEENVIFSSIPESFTVQWNPGNDLNLSDKFSANGVIYALSYINSSEDKDVVLGVPNNGMMKLFLNGELVHLTKLHVPLRANLGNSGAVGDLNNYVVTMLKKGWNQILVKLQSIDFPQESHFTIGGMSTVCNKNHGMPVLGINRSKFIWEK